ncbi:MAG: transporter substrate-binding domain-containing protein [Pirellulales bacterium]
MGLLVAAAAARADEPARVAPEPAAAAGPAEVPRLRVGVMPIASAVDWTGDRPVGVMIDVWENLAGRLGVETEFVRVDAFPALIDLATSGKADVALGPIAITEDRERVIDLTHSIFHSGLRVAVRQRNETGFLAAVRSMLSWQLLELVGIVVALALISGHLLWWFERGRNDHSFPTAYPWGVGEALWWIMSTIMTGGCDDKHVDSVLGRSIAFAWMVGGISLIAAFTSVLTATMTADRVTGTIHGPRDLAGRVVGVQAAAVTGPVVRQRGAIPQEFPSINAALDALALGMVEAVVSENQQLMFLVSQASRNSLRLVGPVFESFDYGLGLPPGSPLREPLNTAILRMREDGSLGRFIEEWFGKHE